MAARIGKKTAEQPEAEKWKASDLPNVETAIPAESGDVSFSDVPEPDGETAHMMDIDLSDEYGPELAPPPVEAGLLTPDQFFHSFRGMFSLPNVFVAPPLSSLEIRENDHQARMVSDKLYDICLKVSWLKWMVKPGGEWAQAAVIIGPWAITMATSVRAELAERRAERLAAIQAAKRQAGHAPEPEPEKAVSAAPKVLPEAPLVEG